MSFLENKGVKLYFFFCLGYYQIPEYKSEPSPALSPYLITSTSSSQTADEIKLIGNLPNQTMRTEHVVDSLHSGIAQTMKLNTTFIFSTDFINFLHTELIPHSAHILQQIENKESGQIYSFFLRQFEYSRLN